MSTSELNCPPSPAPDAEPRKLQPELPASEKWSSAFKGQAEVTIFSGEDPDLGKLQAENAKLRRQLAAVSEYAEKVVRRKDAQLDQYKETLRKMDLESVQVEMRQEIKMQIRKMQLGALRQEIANFVPRSTEMASVGVILKMIEDMESI